MTCSYCKTHRSSGTNCPNCGAAQCEESSIVAARLLSQFERHPETQITRRGTTARSRLERQRPCRQNIEWTSQRSGNSSGLPEHGCTAVKTKFKAVTILLLPCWVKWTITSRCRFFVLSQCRFQLPGDLAFNQLYNRRPGFCNGSEVVIVIAATVGAELLSLARPREKSRAHDAAASRLNCRVIGSLR